VIDSGGLIGSKSSLPVGILLVGGVGIVFGLVTYGHKPTCFNPLKIVTREITKPTRNI
jgi:phosphate/sulfate permease